MITANRFHFLFPPRMPAMTIHRNQSFPPPHFRNASYWVPTLLSPWGIKSTGQGGRKEVWYLSLAPWYRALNIFPIVKMVTYILLSDFMIQGPIVNYTEANQRTWVHLQYCFSRKYFQSFKQPNYKWSFKIQLMSVRIYMCTGILSIKGKFPS